MEPNVIIWLIGIIVFVVLEAVTYQIVSIWFALGAVGGLIASLTGASFTVQMIVFIAVSVIFLICLRPVSRKLLKSKQEKTNVDSMLGKEVLITKEVDNLSGSGQGKVNGVVWTVKSADNSQIPENDIAVVEKVEGVKLIVKRKGE
ncbi:MAG: NfeD family protein [Clostridia bacterium]|nr:NfeD family protein [Clostridia bacterium]